jgi:hypothetical protein
MAVPSLRASQHNLKLPDDIKEKALRWVQTQSATAHRKPSDAPFRRLIDFWFASIAWAVHTGLEPVTTSTGSKFVSIGPKSQDVNIEDWKCNLLMVLAVQSFGHEDPRAQEASGIIDLANRFAEAGAAALVTKLESVEELATPMLYRVTDLFTDEVEKVLASSTKAL